MFVVNNFFSSFNCQYLFLLLLPTNFLPEGMPVMKIRNCGCPDKDHLCFLFLSLTPNGGFVLKPSSKSSVVTSSNVSVQSTIYGISSNNSRPSINRLPRIMVLPLTEILKMIASLEQSPLPAPLAIFSCFYPLPVNLKCNEIQQN